MYFAFTTFEMRPNKISINSHGDDEMCNIPQRQMIGKNCDVLNRKPQFVLQC